MSKEEIIEGLLARMPENSVIHINKVRELLRKAIEQREKEIFEDEIEWLEWFNGGKCHYY